MKKLIYLLSTLLVFMLAVSCGKKKSSDLPLPVERKEAVYITTNNNNLISYNPYTGAKQWEVILKGSCEGVPVLNKKKLYLITNTGYFYSIDILKGDIYLEKDIQKTSRESIAIDGDKVYVSTTDSFYCYDLTGNEIWHYNNGNPFMQCTSSPQIANGVVYFAAGDTLHAVSAGNGSPVWTYAPSSGFDIVSSPRVSNGLVYFGGQDQKIYAVNASNGSLKWEYLTGDKVASSPMVYGGMCILGSADYGIYCIDTTSAPPNGELRWKYPTNDRVGSSPTIHEPTNTVLVGGYDFNLYAIDHVSGLLKWKYPTGSIISSSPVVYGDYVYFNAVDRYLYCVDIRNGSTVWKSFLNGTSESSPMVDDMSSGLYPGISGMSKY
jgi:outer membrane protein assembly factor BamB